MNRFILLLPLLFLSAFPAWSQCTGTFPNNTVCGNVTGSTNTPRPTSSSSFPVNVANPTAEVGLTAVNGTATTAMRSDAAPPLDQAISPTWSGNHTFQNLPSLPLAQNNIYIGNALNKAASSTVSSWFDLVCSSTVGQVWVRATGGWGCTSLGYANPVWWGADPTGTTDSGPAFISAAAASSNIFVPPGKFKFTSSLTFSLGAAGTGLKLSGAGKGATVLYFPNATDGIGIVYNNFYNSVTMNDLSITTGQAGGGNCVTLFMNATGGPKNSPSSIFRNVACRGDDGYNVTDYWINGFIINQVSFVTLDNVDIAGPSTANGTGAFWEGTSTNFAVVLNVIGGDWSNLVYGIQAADYVQGLSVTAWNFSGTNGIYQPSSAHSLAQLAVQGSQFGPYTGNGIEVQAGALGVLIANNFFTESGTSTGGIYLAGNATLSVIGSIVGNHFEASAQHTTTYGVQTVTMNSASPIGNVEIVGNHFWNLGTAVNTATGSQNVEIASNGYGSTFAGSNFFVNGTTSNIRVHDNLGYNPVGATAAANVGTSPATVCAGTSPETHYLKQSATNTATVTEGSQQIATLVNASTYYPIQLGPNDCYVVTWTTTQPTYTKYVH